MLLRPGGHVRQKTVPFAGPGCYNNRCMRENDTAGKPAFDVAIIGAGAVGCATARELTKFRLSVAVLEKECDVAFGASGRNSGVVHAGFNNRTGSLMAKLCVEGSRGFETLCRELDVPYKKTGKLLVALCEEDEAVLRALVRTGEANGCEGLRMAGAEELRRMAPGVNGISAMVSPQTAIFDPFLYTVALAENAAANGARFFFEREVTAIRREDGLFALEAGRSVFLAKYVFNCAGMHADTVSALAGAAGYAIYPCRGEYYILDTIAGEMLGIPVYPAPQQGIGGLGVHLTPTVHGNILIGPSAEYIGEREDYASTGPGLSALLAEAVQLLPSIRKSDVIGAFCGVRAKQSPDGEGGFRDYVIRWEDRVPGLINMIGIESPGMTASVPIARMAVRILGEHAALTPNPAFCALRKGPPRFRELPREEQARLIREDADWGEIVCRCQTVTKKEIRLAAENTLGARSVAGIKYRTWATTGRCQSGYCLTRIAEILEKEYGAAPEEISLRGRGSELFCGRIRP